MLHWIADPVPGLFRRLAGVPAVMQRWCRTPGAVPATPIALGMVLGVLCWTHAGPGVAPAHAEMLSTGVFSDQDAQQPDDPLDPASAMPITPFAGLKAPEAKLGNGVNANPDPAVANVEGHPIYLSDLGEALKTLPDAVRAMPFEVIYPTLLDRMVDHEALVLLALRDKLDEDPKVKHQIEAATARVLEGALLERVAVPQVTEAAIAARYERDYGNKPAVEEVHARHILVPSEDQAKWLINELLHHGADFATLARRYSKDPDATRGGDVGFFRHDQVWPGFADLAFALKPGEVGPTPIFNEFGWHVVQVLERRSVPLPTPAEAHDAIRKELLSEAVQRIVAEARQGLRVHKVDLNGAPMAGSSPTDVTGTDAPGDTPLARPADRPVGAVPVAAPQGLAGKRPVAQRPAPGTPPAAGTPPAQKPAN